MKTLAGRGAGVMVVVVIMVVAGSAPVFSSPPATLLAVLLGDLEPFLRRMACVARSLISHIMNDFICK